MKRHLVYNCILLCAILVPAHLSAVMTGGQFEVYADNFSLIPAESQTSSIYTVSGNIDTGFVSSTGGIFELRDGFQAMERGILSVSLDTDTVALGTLSTTTVTVGSMTLVVSTDSETGYTASLSEDGNLRSGAADIGDVSDGQVTAGVEEYGVRTVGTDGLLATDTAIAGSLAFASSLGGVTNRSTELQFRAAIDSNTTAGSYAHAVSVLVTVNP